MSSTVEQIKAKIGIVEVISPYLKLERAGQNWKARCPFHNEKTPSFFVSPARQTYHCFGCNRGGDIFSFVEEIEGLDFLSALKLLAEKTGTPLESLPREKDKSEKELLYRVLTEAADYYQSQLADDHGAQDYLRNRGLTNETIHSFKLGLAPAGWQNLCHFLAKKHFDEGIILKAGLALRSTKNNTLYDRFRSRLMFPLFDPSGRVIGFSGRIFGPENVHSGGKYVNSPETLVYNKSQTLYGYDRAKVEIRRTNQCLVVEGQMDLLLSHQAGFTQTVAVSGTALTNDHLTLIKRLTDNLILAFDGDVAGLSAASRSIGLALEAGFNLRFVALPKGQDPAELIARDESAWRQAVEGAKPVIDFLLDHLVTQHLDKLTLVHEIEKTVYPYLAVLKSAHDRDHYIAKIVLLTQLPDNSIRERLHSISVVKPESNRRSSPVLNREEKILALLFGLWWSGEAVEERLRAVLGDDLVAKGELLLPRKSELILTAELIYRGMARDKLEQEITELLANLQLERCGVEIDKLRFELSQAERSGNDQEVEKLMRKLQILYQQVSNLKNKK